MTAYKGFTKELTARYGSGNFRFEPGKTYREEESKTARKGFHCTENPFDCLFWYRLGEDNRYFLVEAAGDIDEDEKKRIACTEITLLKELTVPGLVLHGMQYMIRYPKRDWEQDRHMLTVAGDEAEAEGKDHIAIARGTDPRVKGRKGSILGLIKEDGNGIRAAKLFIIGKKSGTKENTWYGLDDDGTLREVCE